MAVMTYKELYNSLGELGAGGKQVDKRIPVAQKEIATLIEQMNMLGDITRESLIQLVKRNPMAVPYLGTCVGLSNDRLKSHLKHLYQTESWNIVSKKHAESFVDYFDENFSLVDEVKVQYERNWSFSDVLFERFVWSKRIAGKAIDQGKALEDAIEKVVKELGLSYKMRDDFIGRRNIKVGCDLRIPAEGEPLIVGAAKTYGSTGSKQGDAVREIRELAELREPRQYVFAFIDGLGWKRRVKDLERIHQMLVDKEINGIYTASMMDQLKRDIEHIAKAHGLLK